MIMIHDSYDTSDSCNSCWESFSCQVAKAEGKVGSPRTKPLISCCATQELKYATADLLELPPKCHRLLCGGEIMVSREPSEVFLMFWSISALQHQSVNSPLLQTWDSGQKLVSQYSEDTTPLEAWQSSAWIGLTELTVTNANECPKQIQEFSLQEGTSHL